MPHRFMGSCARVRSYKLYGANPLFFLWIFLYTPRHRSEEIMTNKESTKDFKFYNTGGRGLYAGYGHIVKMQYFFSSSCPTQAWIRQINLLVIMTKKGSTKRFNIMTSGAGDLVLRRGYIIYTVKMHYLLLYTA